MTDWRGNRPRIDPHTLEAELESYTTAQLLAEVSRRERALREQVEGPVMCEGCIHQRFWTRRGDPPDDFNPCRLSFGVDFKMPESHDPHGDEAGFYRPGGCPERDEKRPPAT